MHRGPLGFVYIVDPGFRATRQIALGCQDRSIPFELYTSFIFNDRGAIAQATGALPRSMSQSVRRLLMRRHLPDLSTSHVTSQVWPETFRRVASTFPRGVRPNDLELYRYQDRLFEFFAARHMPAEAAVVYCTEGVALRVLERASQLGAFAMLEGTVHPDHLVSVLRPEYERLGLDFGGAFSDNWNRTKLEFSASDLIITQSEFAAGTFISHGIDRDKVLVVPLGVDLDTFYPDQRIERQSGRMKVLYVGSLSVRKGLPRLMEALSSVGGSFIELTVVGVLDDALAGYCRQQFKRLGERVRWIPGLSRRELVSLYREADVVVLPSICDSFGQSVLEAMACGTAVLVTDACGVSVTNGHDGVVVPAGDSEALAAALEAMASSDRRLLTDLGQSGAATARAHGWSVYRLKMTDAIVSELVAGRDASAHI